MGVDMYCAKHFSASIIVKQSGFVFAGSAEKLFTMCDEYADNQRRKSQVWPLQNTLLILCPVSVKHNTPVFCNCIL